MLGILLFGFLFSIPALVLRFLFLKRKASIFIAIAYGVLLYFFHSIAMTMLLGDAIGVGLSVSLSVVIMLWQPRSEYGSNDTANTGGPNHPGDRAL